jgi:hypothetical protein
VLQPKEQKAMIELVSEWEVKGRAEEALTLVSRQLQRKLGLLPPEITDRLGALAITQLEALAEALLDFTAVDDLTTWLDAQVSHIQSPP